MGFHSRKELGQEEGGREEEVNYPKVRERRKEQRVGDPPSPSLFNRHSLSLFPLL